MAKAIYLIWAT